MSLSDKIIKDEIKFLEEVVRIHRSFGFKPEYPLGSTMIKDKIKELKEFVDKLVEKGK